jgi:hypothetical protein
MMRAVDVEARRSPSACHRSIHGVIYFTTPSITSRYCWFAGGSTLPRHREAGDIACRRAQVISGSLRRQKPETGVETVQGGTCIHPRVLETCRSLGHNEQADRLPTHARPHDTEKPSLEINP